jgi:hypothetical protein
MTDFTAVRNTLVDPALLSTFVTEPPGWTRLEPQSMSGDPTPGLEARIHDPLWALARQWQFGEYAAEDAGTPVAVHVSTSTAPVTGWTPGTAAPGSTPIPLPASGLLDQVIEREPAPPRGPGLRSRAEAGSQLLAQLADAGVDTGGPVGHAVLAACPLPVPGVDPFDRAAPLLLAVLGGRVPDGETAALKLAPGLTAQPPTLPAWLDGVPDPNAALAAAADWLRWYRGQVAPLPDPTTDSWIQDRLEYRFGVSVGSLTLQAPEFGGGRINWYTVDAAPPIPNPAVPPPPPGTAAQTMLATPLRFAGMPADRYWEFEDGQVNLGALEVQPHDLARLLLVEFATLYSNDWLIVPVDVTLGSFTTVDAVSYTTTFGEQIPVGAADDSGRTGRFRLFELNVAGTDSAVPGLFIPPSAALVQDGPAVEEVLFLRDEMANSAWAVERIVEGPSGDPRTRRDEGYPPPFSPDPDPRAELDYLLQSDVPAWWIPFLPTSTGIRTLELRKGAMVVNNQPVEALGVLLKPGTALAVRDEEIPREGVRVRRIPSLARLVDGTYARWTARHTTVGRGEGASGLVFDATIARRTAP